MTSSILDLSICALLIGATVSISSYHYQRQRLESIVRQVLGDTADHRERMFILARFIFSNVTRNQDPVFILRALRFLGGSPLAIFKHGGCCSGIHRLFIASLETIGIQSAQITLYHRSGAWCHCLVQVSIDSQPLLVDVDYGVYFEGPGGGPLGLAQLRNGIRPTIRPFADGLLAPLCAGYNRNPAPGYPNNEYYDFDFSKSRTANWVKSWRRKQAHRFLTLLTRGSIDSLLFAPFLEWPQVTLAICTCAAAVALLVANAALGN